jgi:hypothetical protein
MNFTKDGHNIVKMNVLIPCLVNKQEIGWKRIMPSDKAAGSILCTQMWAAIQS